MLRSVAAAVAVLLCLLWSGQQGPLPAFGWAAAFLFLAVQQDVMRMRIPNWLTFSSLLGALALAAFTGGLSALAFALGGTAVAFGILFVPFAAGWLGAGDVKAMMVLGALFGASVLLGVLWWIVLAGGAVAVVCVAVTGGVGNLLRRWRDTIALTFATRRWTYVPPPAGSVAAIPFALAMGLGVAAYQFWGMPWQ